MVTVFGEILFDVYPDARYLGGAPLNFLYHLQALSVPVTMISRIGADDAGSAVRQFFAENSLSTECLQIDLEKATGTAHVRVDNRGIPHFSITEDSAFDFIEANDQNGRLVSSSDMLYYGTLARRNIGSREAFNRLVKRAAKCFCDINLRQQYYSTELIHQSLQNADIVKLNDKELEIVHSLFSTVPYKQDNAARLLLEQFSLTCLAVTMGENGSWCYTQQSAHFQKTIAPRVLDTVGAGDAFAAVLCAGLIKQLSIEHIHELASRFSAEVCTFRGALPHDAGIYAPYKKALSDE